MLKSVKDSVIIENIYKRNLGSLNNYKNNKKQCISEESIIDLNTKEEIRRCLNWFDI